MAAAAVQFGGDSLLELASWQGLDLGGDVDLGAGDLLGAALWSLSLYYASPWQARGLGLQLAAAAWAYVADLE